MKSNLLLAFPLFQIVFAHSYLTFPEPYTRDNCKGGTCQACPDIYHSTRMANTELSPAVTWKRGQNITIVWARNNHGGGIVRIAFVPISERKDISAHSKYAFYYGCWEQNIFPCTGSLCGSDKTRRAYRAFTSVPPVIPDGIYVLAQVWYGGLKWTRHRGAFSNYASCSFVRIKGGVALQPSFKPVYEPGTLGEFESSPPGKCLTSAVKVGECLTGCDNVASFYAIPYEFQNGRSPMHLTPALYGGAPAYTSSPKESSTYIISNDSEPNNNFKKHGRICKYQYCCPRSCGKCGGRGCAKRPGGIDACCTQRIRAARRSCSKFLPPCIRSRS